MRCFGMEFGFRFLGSHHIKGSRLVTSFSYSGKIKYTDSIIEKTFFTPRTKFKEGFITWAPLNILLKLYTVSSITFYEQL